MKDLSPQERARCIAWTQDTYTPSDDWKIRAMTAFVSEMVALDQAIKKHRDTEGYEPTERDLLLYENLPSERTAPPIGET